MPDPVNPAGGAPAATTLRAMVTGLVLLGALGALSILPPYLGPPLGLELDVASDVEVVDHVIPGAIVVISSLLAATLLRTERITLHSLVLAVAVGVSLLCGVWQLSSHVPLVLDAGQPNTQWGTVIFHSTMGPVVAGTALALLLRVLAVDPATDQGTRR